MSGKVLRASAGTYARLLPLNCVPLALGMALVIRGARDATEFVFVAALLPLFWIAWLRAFELRITKDSIVYRTPFFRVQQLQRSQIESIEVGRRGPGLFSKRIPIVTIRSRCGTQTAINARIFSGSDLQEQLERNEWVSIPRD